MKIQSEMQSCPRILEETVQLSWGVGFSGALRALPCLKQDGWEWELAGSREARPLSEVVVHSAAASPPYSPTTIPRDDHPGSCGGAVHGQPSATLRMICSTRPTALGATVPRGKPSSHIRRAGLVVQGLTSLSSLCLEHSTPIAIRRECSRLVQQTYDRRSRCRGGTKHIWKPRLPLGWKSLSSCFQPSTCPRHHHH